MDGSNDHTTEPLIRTSPTLAALITDLVEASKEFEDVIKDAEVEVRSKREGTRSYKFRYPTLAGMVAATRPHLLDKGLVVIQMPCAIDGRVILATRLLHKSGEWIESGFPVLVEAAGPQALGSALTYTRRYAYAALLCLVADKDDDGNAAQGNQVDQRTDGRSPYLMFSDKGAPERDLREPNAWAHDWKNQIAIAQAHGDAAAFRAFVALNEPNLIAVARACPEAAADVRAWIATALQSLTETTPQTTDEEERQGTIDATEERVGASSEPTGEPAPKLRAANIEGRVITYSDPDVWAEEWRKRIAGLAHVEAWSKIDDIAAANEPFLVEAEALLPKFAEYVRRLITQARARAPGGMPDETDEQAAARIIAIIRRAQRETQATEWRVSAAARGRYNDIMKRNPALAQTIDTAEREHLAKLARDRVRERA